MKYIYLIITALIIQGCSIFGVHQYEMPKYEVVIDEQPYELRKYEKYTVAEVTIYDDDIDEAQRRGFRILADYIFGENIARNSVHRRVRMKEGEVFKSNEEIDMTGPVMLDANESIEMTGPVLLDLNDQIVVRGPANVVNMITPEEMVEFDIEIQQKWTISFSLPAKYTLNNAPIPKSPAVRLREKEGELVITRRFSNFVSKEKVEDLGSGLLAWANEKGLVIEGSVRIARYDPMWTIPFLRRNEIHLSVKM
jgi:hypothetical protein